MDVERFHADGFVVLGGAFDADALGDELERSFADGFPSSAWSAGSGGIEFRSMPMMCERTPVSMALVDALAPVAATLLGRAVLPGRAKGTRYRANAALHRDSEDALASLSFVAYLETLRAGDGAFCIVPRSHLDRSADAPVAVETVPGDVVAFDDHCLHGSEGDGDERRQWRIDFVADPVDAGEERLVRATFASIFAPGWDGGYDASRYPSYGRYWQSLDRPWTARLRDLGVYDMALAHESAMQHGRRP